MKVHVISWWFFISTPTPQEKYSHSRIHIFSYRTKINLVSKECEKKTWLWTFVKRTWSKSILKKKPITHIDILVENREKNRFRKFDCQNNSSLIMKHTNVFDALTYWSVLTSSRRLVIKFQETWYSWYLCVGIWSNSK